MLYVCLLFYLDMGNRRKSWALFCEHYVVSLSVFRPSHYDTVNVALVLILPYVMCLCLRLISNYVSGPVH